MRPKILFRAAMPDEPAKKHGRKRRRTTDHALGETIGAALDNVDLVDPVLVEIIQGWRSIFEDEYPSRQDIVATMKALTRLEDEAVPDAMDTLHNAVEAALIQTAIREGMIPKDACSPGGWPPDRIRAMAKTAITALPTTIGRPSFRDSENQFSDVLVSYWRALGWQATITVESDTTRESEFLSWAFEMFRRVGRCRKSASLAKILRRATRKPAP